MKIFCPVSGDLIPSARRSRKTDVADYVLRALQTLAADRGLVPPRPAERLSK